MRYDKSDSFLTAAFLSVKEYDEALYQRMVADDEWVVTSNPRDIPAPMLATEDAVMSVSSAFGSTWDNVNNPIPVAFTFIYAEMCNEWAKNHKVSAPDFASAIVVHEYRHAHQTQSGDAAEITAFKASSQYATLLPAPEGPEIKALSDKTGRSYA